MEGHKKLQRKSTKKQETVSTQLHELTKYLFQGQSHEVDENYHLEDQWTDVINSSLQVYMTNKARLQQRAIWEFLSTEKNYIKKLRLIVQVFLQSFKLIQGEGELQDVEERDVFGNINEVFLANDDFWMKHVLVVLNRSRTKRTSILPSELLQCLYQVDETFAPYLQFCILQDGCLKNIRYVMEQVESKSDNNINFKSWLTWCQNLPQCERSKLADLMTEPMQRLTRYPLLLKKICSETSDEEEIRKLETMIRSAERFAYNINKAVRMKEEKVRLELCLKEFDYYSVMDAGCEEVKWIAIDFLRLNVQGLAMDEPRCILKHSPMKMIEKKGKMEQAIELFLFTDLIALARMRRSTNKLTIIRQLYFLDKVKLLKSQSSETGIVFIYLDEAGLLATTFVLEVNNIERDITGNDRDRKRIEISHERDTWVTTILKAKKIYERARNGIGSTLDYFQEDTSSKPESEHKIAPSKPISVPNGNDNTYDDIGITLLGKTSQNGTLSYQSSYGDTLPCRSIPEDHTANWVLTNKEQRGSIPSDISSEHCRVGESFKSNKSDSDIIPSSDSGVSIRTCSSVPDLANVEKLRALPRIQSFDVSEEDSGDDIHKQHGYHSRIENVYDHVDLPLNNKYCLVDKQTQTDFG